MKKTNPLKVIEIEEYASNFRKEFSIDEDDFFPIFEVIEELAEKNRLSYEIVEEDTYEDDIKAMYDAKQNCIFIKESILNNYYDNNYTANFTLAHEIFHYCQNQILNFEFEDVEECLPYEQAEWQANEFAAQLLIPTKYIDLEPEVISEKFHVSKECASYRKLKYEDRAKRRLEKEAQKK